MMDIRRISFVVLALLCTLSFLQAQSPQKINYQAVARNAQTGEVLVGQEVFVSLAIRIGSPSGEIIYQEDHSEIETNDFGLFNLQIGGGEALVGEFDEISWGQEAFWLEVLIDVGSGLESLGTMQFVSVPYALHARTVTNADDADADPANELITSGEYDVSTGQITIEEGSGNVTDIDVSQIPIDDADADPANELITSGEYDISTGQITIEEGSGNVIDIDISQIPVDDADPDPQNELINQAVYDSDDQQITIQEGDGNTVNIDLSGLSTDDADSDPSNEAITQFSLLGTSLVLSEVITHTVSLARFRIDSLQLVNGSTLAVYEGGTSFETDLSALSEDDDWFRSEDEEVVFNTSDNVGVGTPEPEAKFSVKNSNPGQPDFSVRNAGDIPMIHVAANKVGIGTDEPKSSFELRGSLGMGVTIIEADDSPYTVTETDNIIVWKLSAGGPATVILEMPDPATCLGRIITVRKTGPVPGASNVQFDFDGAQLDYSSTSLIISGSQTKTISLLSLGEDGWTELFSP